MGAGSLSRAASLVTAGAFLGGLLLSLGFERPELCLVLAVPGVVAAGVVSVLAKRNVDVVASGHQPVTE